MRYLSILLGVLLLSSFSVPTLADDSDNSSGNVAQGAVIGASTQVVVSQTLDAVMKPEPEYAWVQGPDGQYYWQEIPQEDSMMVKYLKRAVTGAVTGAVSAELAKNESTDKSDTKVVVKEKIIYAEHDDHERKGHHPHGWEKGKKVGWKGKGHPPGISKKEWEKYEKYQEKRHKHAEKEREYYQKKIDDKNKKIAKLEREIEKLDEKRDDEEEKDNNSSIRNFFKKLFDD